MIDHVDYVLRCGWFWCKFCEMCSTLLFVISLPCVTCYWPLRLMYFDLIDFDKWGISWSKLRKCGRFTREILGLMTIHFIVSYFFS